jgi:predicted nuclease of restriction endonuclease-like (RecB) superfamily
MGEFVGFLSKSCDSFWRDDSFLNEQFKPVSMKKPQQKAISQTPSAEYGGLIGGIAELLEAARRTAARSVNALMTATYWEIGRRIVEFEQQGAARAGYGEQILSKLSHDLTERFGRGFGRRNLFQIRAFYLAYRSIVQTSSAQLVKEQTLSAQSRAGVRATPLRESGGLNISESLSRKSPLMASNLRVFAAAFPLPWSHYVRLLSTKSAEARRFYETEALRGGWSVRQLDRQIASQFYERTGLSRDKNAMLRKAAAARAGDSISADEEVRDPLVLEFLGLKDEYSETDLEEALLRHLENFLLELGGDFAFVGRQRRLRIGGEWYRVDLLFFHRKLRCLVVIDLKVGKFTHADAGQMHLYLNYAREHWAQPDENPPVGLILCAEKDDAIAKYALEGLPNKVLAREYKLALPNEKRLAAEIEKTRDLLERRTRK